MREHGSGRTFRILIVAQESDARKLHNAKAIAGRLEAGGHRVALIDAERTTVLTEPDGVRLVSGGETLAVSEFDAATLRSPTEVVETRTIADALERAGTPVFQDWKSLVDGGDKTRSQRIFEANGVPAPRTIGYLHDEVPEPRALEAFLADVHPGPYVVKENRGWSGKQVSVVDTADEALVGFARCFEKARVAGVGGALIQEFVESGLPRRRDIRIETVAGPGPDGALEARALGSVMRVAKPGMRVGNASLGADEVRVALDRADAFAFHVTREGMSEAECERRLASGDIPLLDPRVKAAAERAALGFGCGELGIDIVCDHGSGEPRVLEVNPFSSSPHGFEDTYGFSIYQPWADAIVAFARLKARRARSGQADFV